ncbi:hypothetical protein GCM10027449_14570 [Sinomonas notoginsengisoli]
MRPLAESRNALINASSDSRPTVPGAEAITASIVAFVVDLSNWPSMHLCIVCYTDSDVMRGDAMLMKLGIRNEKSIVGACHRDQARSDGRPVHSRAPRPEGSARRVCGSGEGELMRRESRAVPVPVAGAGPRCGRSGGGGW